MVDQKTADTIKKEKQAAEEKSRKIADDNKFTLTKKGKTIFEHDDKERIIEFLEQYEIAYWGRYFKYECAGEICAITYENLNEDMDEILFDNLDAEISDCMSLDGKLVQSNFGWPEQGGYLLVIVKVDGKYELKIEDYDFE